MLEMTEEADGEGQEDVFALMDVPAALASPRRDGGEAGETAEKEDGSLETGSGEETPAPVELGERGGGRSAGDILRERPEAADEAGADERAGVLWKDGPVWTVESGAVEAAAVQRLALAGRTERADAVRTDQDSEIGGTVFVQRTADGLERGLRMRAAETAPDGARQAPAAGSGLEGLYRQTVQAARPAAPALAPEQAGRTIRAQEPGSAASLAVDELDRAVRRDSRRYDGGLSIF